MKLKSILISKIYYFWTVSSLKAMENTWVTEEWWIAWINILSNVGNFISVLVLTYDSR